MTTMAAPVAKAFRDFFTGVGLLARGVRACGRKPRLILLGLIPALITGALFLAAYAALIYFVDDLAELLTPFADHWGPIWRDTLRVSAVIALLGLGALLGVLAFTSVTLLVGDPFYEKISEQIEAELGGVPGEVELPWWRSLRYSLVDSLRLLATTTLIGVPMLIGGLIPVVGQTVVPVIGALVGGWFLAVELVGTPFYRRGMRLPERRRVLRGDRFRALGFGVAVFCCFLIPLGSILIMPAAVVGATLLTRNALGLPIEVDPARSADENGLPRPADEAGLERSADTGLPDANSPANP